MDSSDIRWLIAGLFVAFLLTVVLSDLAKRRPKPPKMKPHEGFRSVRREPPPQARPQTSWKTPRS
jgi:hypothetical protein